MNRKKFVAWTLTAVVTVSSLCTPRNIYADISPQEEYVIMTVDRESLKKVIQLKGVEMMENASDPDGLRELNAAVVRMNSKKAKALASKSQVLYAGSFSLDKKNMIMFLTSGMIIQQHPFVNFWEESSYEY